MVGFSVERFDPEVKIYTVEIFDEQRITVTITATPSVVESWLNERLREVKEQDVVAGIGVEWTHGGGEDRPADTLQICFDLQCLIFQLSVATTVPDKLRTFLNNPLHKFYGLWNISDRRKLQLSNHALVMAKDPLDASLYAKAWEFFGEEDLSEGTLNDIVEKCIGIDPLDLDLSVITESDWHSVDLNALQIVYAVVDAYSAWTVGYERELYLTNNSARNNG